MPRLPTANVLPDQAGIPRGRPPAARGPAAARSPAVPPAATPPGEAEPSGLIDMSAWLRESPPWLVSAIVHMGLLIFIGLWVVTEELQRSINLEATYTEEIGEQMLEDDLNLPAEADLTVDEQVWSPQALPAVDDPFAAPAPLEINPLGSLATSERSPTAIGQALTGREPGMKQALLAAFGGTESTEAAVTEGLRWLVRRQQKSGLWSLRGPYRDGSNIENEEAATAMALLAFQGAGYTHQSDASHPFTPVVTRGWNQLLRRQNDDGRFFNDVIAQQQLYTQALCTIAICELYGMTRDEAYRKPAQRAIDYCVRIQASEGGWKYNPGSGSDMSVTGWFVMALQSARMAGLEVPSDVFAGVERFLESVSRENGSRYAYESRDGPRLALTAEGLLCRQYLGWKRDDPRLRQGVDYLLNNLPDYRYEERNVYYWYYGTQVCHHMEGDDWRIWNEVTRQMIPEHQQKRGADRGSWDPGGDRWGGAGGAALCDLFVDLHPRGLLSASADLSGWLAGAVAGGPRPPRSAVRSRSASASRLTTPSRGRKTWSAIYSLRNEIITR